MATSRRRMRSRQEDSLDGLGNGRPEFQEWGLRDIDWSFIFSQQHYGSLFYTIFPCLALGLILWAFEEEPELRSPAITLQNPDYHLPKKSGTIPAVVAVLVPLVLFFVTLLIGELLIFKAHHRHITDAVYVIVYFILSWFCAFAVHIFAQQISAIAVAEPRPDYADRCGRTDDTTYCTREAQDGLRSFFSGHASSAALSAVYSSIYLLWLVYFRRVSHDYSNPSCHPRKTWKERFLHEFVHATILYLIVVQLGFAWVVGVSRIIDNRHHIWDVTCGLFVGVIVAAFFAIHAIAALPMMPRKDI